jgi:hypothetical protein
MARTTGRPIGDDGTPDRQALSRREPGRAVELLAIVGAQAD